ncbi:MAG: nucleotidyl transferase AbiEii/AbiGii toxin family protein, partial [Thermofilaceae archaeon]
MAGSRIPLIRLLRGKLLRVAELQDAVIVELSRRADFVLRGGTAVWRVYGGKRFSYDIDIYCSQPEDLPAILSRNFNVVHFRVTGTGYVYIRIGDREIVEVEAARFAESVDWVESEYWLVDGTKLVVKALSPCALLEEKASAYLDRRRARDLYDVFYMMDFCENVEKLRNTARSLLGVLAEPPEDYDLLDELILAGRAPSFGTIAGKVRRIAS